MPQQWWVPYRIERYDDQLDDVESEVVPDVPEAYRRGKHFRTLRRVQIADDQLIALIELQDEPTAEEEAEIAARGWRERPPRASCPGVPTRVVVRSRVTGEKVLDRAWSADEDDPRLRTT